MSTKKEEILYFLLKAVMQGVINGIVLIAVLKIFKVI